MSDTEQFFLTLNSDSQCVFRDENSNSKFRVHLGKLFELTGRWQVALFEIYFPGSLHNIREKQCYIDKILIKPSKKNDKQEPSNSLTKTNPPGSKSKFQRFYVPAGDYRSQKELLEAISDCTAYEICYIVEPYDPNRLELVVKKSDSAPAVYKFSKSLLSILGLPWHKEFKSGEMYREPSHCDLRKGLPTILTVTTDLISGQQVNNVHENILRSIYLSPDTYKHGFRNHALMKKLVFLPVVKSAIDSIEISIKDEYGRNFSFADGPLGVILLLRKVRT